MFTLANMYMYLSCGFLAIGRCPQLNLTKHHLIPGECACLVGEEVLYPSEFLRDGTASYDRVGNGLVSLDHPGVDQLAHVQVDTQAFERNE